MRHRIPRFSFRPVVVVALIALLTPLICRADFVFLHDGFTLRGRVYREGQNYRDPTGQMIWMPKIGGFFVVDDTARRMVFSYKNVSEARADPAERRDVLESFKLRQTLLGAANPLYSFRIASAGPWDERGTRRVELDTGAALLPVTQMITLLTPDYVRVNARSYNWYCTLLTRELGPKLTLAMIRAHLQKNPMPGGRLDEGLSIFRFCVQASWYEEAEAELKALQKEFPNEQERFETALGPMRRLRAGHRLEEIRLARRAGQHQRVQSLLAGFPEEGAAETVLQEIRSLRQRYKEMQANLQATRWLLASAAKDVQNQVAAPLIRTPFEEALKEIEEGLNLDTCPRLEAFQTLATQELMNKMQDKPVETSPEQLLALAVSGWALGSNSAEAEVSNALRLWQARQFLLKFLREPAADQRAQILGEYNRSEALRFDVIGQLIELLPPAMPAAAPAANGGPASFELSVLTPRNPKGTNYLVQLPPEYHPQRPYPLLVVLHNVGEPPKHALESWSELAARHGYILVAPKWTEDAFQNDYRFSEREHQVVLDVVRDVRRRFNADPDRTFLTGFSLSGLMAYDVGLSHPDLFAGVVVMCGRPRENIRWYRPNAQYLPFYVIEGERDGNGATEAREMFKYWVPKGFASVYVEYNGRGFEFFHGELPTVFDWLDRKRRGKAFPSFGIKDSKTGVLAERFHTLRPGDNRFYWVSVDELDNVSAVRPGELCGYLSGANQLTVQTARLKRLTVWLNADMVDFDQPVEIRVNPSAPSAKTIKGEVKPSLKILLDDFYERVDKGRLFMAKREFKL